MERAISGSARSPAVFGRDGLVSGALAIWAIVIVLTPFYVLPSGLPQPADVVLAGLIGCSILVFGWQTYPRILPAITWAVAFFLLTIIVNLSFGVIRQNTAFVLPVLFMSFNAITFLFALAMGHLEARRFSAVTGNAAAIALSLQVIVSIALGGVSNGRAHLFFNNPNQLGYFALTAATLMVVCSNSVRLFRGALPAGLIAGLYLCALSLSKAALLGYGLLLILVWIRLSKRTRVRTILAAAVLVAALATSGVMGRWLILSNVSTRLESIGVSNDDNLTARGYARIWRYPQYLAFGSGESEWSRWTLGQAKELHSSWGTILFAYGFFGLSLFIGLLISTAQTAGLRSFAFLTPLFFYGLTHQGLREPLFWVSLALVLIGSESLGRREAIPDRAFSDYELA